MNDEQAKSPEMNDPLDAMLRNADEYILDNGFTARVVKSLPLRRRRGWLRFVLISMSLFVGTGLIVWQYPAIEALSSTALNQTTISNWAMYLLLVPPLTALVSLGWGIFALINDEE